MALLKKRRKLLQNSTGLESRCAATPFWENRGVERHPCDKILFQSEVLCGVSHTTVWFQQRGAHLCRQSLVSNLLQFIQQEIFQNRRISQNNRYYKPFAHHYSFPYKKFFFSFVLLCYCPIRVVVWDGFVDSLTAFSMKIPRRSTMRNVSAIEQLCCVSGGCTSR